MYLITQITCDRPVLPKANPEKPLPQTLTKLNQAMLSESGVSSTMKIIADDELREASIRQRVRKLENNLFDEYWEELFAVC